MLTIEPAIFSRRMMRTLSWMRKNGARTFDVEDLVVALLGGVENIAAISQRGGVDQGVDTAEALIRLRDHFAAIGDLREIGLDKDSRTAGRRDFARDPLAALAFRPQITSPAAPRSPKSRAMASPSPCVPPVTIATLPFKWAGPR